MKKYCILGQSNYAVAIILENLTAREQRPFAVDIVANMPKENNDSLGFPYTVPNIFTREIYFTDWNTEGSYLETSGGYDGYFVGSIGKARQAIVSFFKKNFGIQPYQYETLIHPSSVCALTTVVGAGVHISPMSVVAPYAQLGDFTTINRNVSVGHHTVLEDFVTFNPGTNIAGCCHVGKGVTVGAGATILDSIKIGAGSIIGAGSVVTKDIPENVVAYGSPAKVIRAI